MLSALTPAGLVSWYRAEGNANDFADGNHGTALNGATFAAGKVGQAFSFDGVDDFIEVPHAANLSFAPTSAFTIEMWAFRTSATTIQHLLGKRIDNAGPADFNYQVPHVDQDPALNLPLNAWTHVAHASDGTTYRIFLNGTLVFAGPVGDWVKAEVLTPLRIGTSGSVQPFGGLIDEVSIYNRALTQAEIQSIAGADSEGKTTVVVDTTLDTVAADGVTSLREAITLANTTPGRDAIGFNIAGAGVQTLTPATALPEITDPVIIDGYTQPGSSPNTLANSDNAVLLIELNGATASAAQGDARGLWLTAGNSTVRGLAINRFLRAGIELAGPGGSYGGNGGNVIEGNFLGPDAAGAFAGFQYYGLLTFTPGNTIGGTLPRARNIISGNEPAIVGSQAFGISINSDDNSVVGNFIGTDPTGTLPVRGPSGQVLGIDIQTPTAPLRNTVGGTAPGAANVIAFNGTDNVGGGGVRILGGNNAILSNSIHNNIGVGIGGSNLQSAPALSAAVLSGGSLTVTYNVPSAHASTVFPIRVEFFQADSDGEEGEVFLGFDSFSAADAAAGTRTVSFTPVAAPAQGRRLVATATDAGTNTSMFSQSSALAPSLVVDTTADTIAGDGVTSLREAITHANAALGLDTIGFNIPGAGVQTITPATALPEITDPVIIDGYTQPGSSPNTLANGDNAVLLIELNGATATLAEGADARGLYITTSDSIVRGLVINRFGRAGIEMGGVSGGNLIEGNFIGPTPSGAYAGFQNHGIIVFSANNTIGGTLPGARNVISGNAVENLSGTGIVIANAANNVVLGNFIGPDPTGTLPVRSAQGIGQTIGVNVQATRTIVGGTAPGAGNLIAFNGNGNAGGGGVQMIQSTSSAILSNSIHNNIGNVGNGIFGQNLQSAPTLSAAVLSGGSLTVTYNVPAVQPATVFPIRVEFFQADSDGEEGEVFLGFDTFSAADAATGTKTVTFTPVAAPARGRRLLATASDPGTNTSMFSQSIALPIPLVVDTTADTIADDGVTSLREAITLANAAPGRDTIGFNIPGAGVQTIAPTTALPDITDPVIIDGYTQPGSSPNTLANGDNAVLLIELSGSNAGAGSSGLSLTAGNSIVRGLVVNRFDGRGIALATNGGNLIEGNFLGTDAAGTSPAGNRIAVRIASAFNTIGGTSPAARNLIATSIGSGLQIVSLGGNDNRVLGNFIGTDQTGTLALANGFHDVFISEGSRNTIGGTTAGAGNLIAFTPAFGSRSGVFLSEGTSNAVLSNSIHGHSGPGIELDQFANNGAQLPELVAAGLSGGMLTVTYRMPSANLAPFRVEFFKADADGDEGQTFLGFDTFTAADFAAGDKTVAFIPSAATTAAERVLATGTNAASSTSRFSASVLVAAAPPLTWSGLGADALWSTGANWVGGASPSAADRLIFPAGAAQLASTNDLAFSFAALTFGDAAYVIGGQPLTITGTITADNLPGKDISINVPLALGAAAGTQSITVTNAGAVVDLTQTLSNAGGVGLTKAGAGTLRLGGDNGAFSGTIDIQAGVLQAGHANALGQTAQGSTVADGAALWLEAISTAEPLALRGQGSAASGALRALSGPTEANGPITLLGNTSIHADVPDVLLNFVFSLRGAIGDGGNSYSVDLIGPGVVAYRGTAANTYSGSTRVSNGRLDLGKSGGAAFAGPLLVGGAGNDAEVVWAGDNQLPANAAVTVNARGRLRNGDLDDSFGSLTIGGGDVTIGDGAGSATVVVNTVTMTGGGSIKVARRSFATIDTLSMTGGNVTLESNAGGTARLTLTGNMNVVADPALPSLIDGAGIFILSAAAHTFQVGDGPNAIDLRIDAIIDGNAGDLVKTGAGRLQLSQASTYRATAIQQGEVEVTGAIGAVSLEGGTLSGNGSVAAVTATGAAGVLAPGSTAASLDATLLAQGDVTLTAQSTFAVDLQRQGPADKLQLEGNASIQGAILSGTSAADVAEGDAFVILETLGAASSVAGRFFQTVNGTPTEIGQDGIASLGGVAYQVRYNTRNVTLTRGRVRTVTVIASSANPSAPGQEVIVTATVSPFAPDGTVPSGSVSFFLDDAQAGAPVPLDGAGRASLTLGVLSGGSHRLRASYTGTARFAPSATAGDLLQIVNGSPFGRIATALDVGTVGAAPLAVADALVVATEIDLYRFTVSAGQVVRFDVAQVPGAGLDSFLRLLDENGTQLVFNDDGPTPGQPFSRNPSLTHRFERAGTYFVGVSGYPNYRYNAVTGFGVVPGSTGGYALRIALAAPERDDNDQLREATSLGTVTEPRQVRDFVITTPSDVDLFRFRAGAGQRLTISVTRAAGSSLAPALRVFNAAGRALAGTAGRTRAQLTFRVPAAGFYYIGVAGQGNAGYDVRSGNNDRPGATGAYVLTLTPTSRATRRRPDAVRRVQAVAGAQVSGHVYADLSGDGQQQGGEVGVSSHTIIVDRNNNGLRDDGELTASTDRRGQFLFTALPSGRAPVFAAPVAQFGIAVEKITAPQRGFYLVVMHARRPVTRLAFGMSRYLA